MKIIKATVLLRDYGADIVYLHTDFPSPFPPEVSSDMLVLTFEVKKGDGARYVEDNFNIIPEIIGMNK